MNNTIAFTDELDGSEHIIIKNENGSIESMSKAEYERRLEAQREQSGTL